MGCYIDASGGYFEGDSLPGASAVPQRPSPFHAWSGSAWTENLAAARAAAMDAVNAKAEEVRARFVTPGATQAMVYIQKAQQAQAYAAAGYTGPVPSLVQSEATATAATAHAAADSILAQAAACIAVAAQVDTLRRKAKVDSDAAASVAAIEAARDTALVALDAIHP